jgi:high-affinity iron transporter
VIQGVFNVTPTPTVLQLVCWLAYLVVILAVFLRPLSTARKAAPSPDSEPTSERSTR